MRGISTARPRAAATCHATAEWSSRSPFIIVREEKGVPQPRLKGPHSMGTSERYKACASGGSEDRLWGRSELAEMQRSGSRIVRRQVEGTRATIERAGTFRALSSFPRSARPTCGGQRTYIARLTNTLSGWTSKGPEEAHETYCYSPRFSRRACDWLQTPEALSGRFNARTHILRT
jgi:hypothetical protein